MAENELPPLDQVGKKRTFTTITTTANNLIKKCKNVVEEEKLAVLVEGLESATKEYLSIMLEKLDLAEILTHSPKGKFLYELDLKTLFSAEAKEVEEATVSLECNIMLSKLKNYRYFHCWKHCKSTWDKSRD